MEEQLISFETAKLAKEKGLRVRTKNLYSDKKAQGELMTCEKTYDFNTYKMPGDGGWAKSYGNMYAAITQSLLQKWLRDGHDINIDIETLQKDDYIIYSFELVYIIETLHVKPFKCRFNSYEEALEAGLQQALKLIK